MNNTDYIIQMLNSKLSLADLSHGRIRSINDEMNELLSEIHGSTLPDLENKSLVKKFKLKQTISYFHSKDIDNLVRELVTLIEVIDLLGITEQVDTEVLNRIRLMQNVKSSFYIEDVHGRIVPNNSDLIEEIEDKIDVTEEVVKSFIKQVKEGYVGEQTKKESS